MCVRGRTCGCISVCMHLYVRVCVRIGVCVYVYTRVVVSVCVHTRVFVHVSVYTWMCVRVVDPCTCALVRTCVCGHTCSCVCISVCVHVRVACRTLYGCRYEPVSLLQGERQMSDPLSYPGRLDSDDRGRLGGASAKVRECEPKEGDVTEKVETSEHFWVNRKFRDHVLQEETSRGSISSRQTHVRGSGPSLLRRV